LGGIAAGQEERSGGILAAIDRADLPLSIPPGATVQVTARIVKSFGSLFLVKGEARIGDKSAASATLTLAVGPFSTTNPIPLLTSPLKGEESSQNPFPLEIGGIPTKSPLPQGVG
jgi:hypothetical protein